MGNEIEYCRVCSEKVLDDNGEPRVHCNEPSPGATIEDLLKRVECLELYVLGQNQKKQESTA